MLSVTTKQLISGNLYYNQYKARWEYLYNSFVGGEDYSRAGYLSRYSLETDKEYLARCASTPLDNQCKSVISTFNSFLFRSCPTRDLGSMEGMPEIEDLLADADFDGRSMDAFMREVSTWAQVFGHSWVIISKPNVDAQTLADQQALGIRPFLSILSPLVVLDWKWERDISGRYELTYLKYLEDVNNDVSVIKEFTKDVIVTSEVDNLGTKVYQRIEEVNQLGSIPAVISYADRSIVRGIGISAITDVADLQRYIYNAMSEAEQSIRLDSHPSLVTTAGTEVGSGAGSIITVDENTDAGLKPYILDFNGASIQSIYTVIDKTIGAIEKITNIGAVRATETRTSSGIALETEFQLLNARLSSIADNLELTEEQIWKIIAQYQGVTYDGCVEYPDSFAIRDTQNEISQLQTAAGIAQHPLLKKEIDIMLAEALGVDEETIAIMEIEEDIAELTEMNSLMASAPTPMPMDGEIATEEAMAPPTSMADVNSEIASEGFIDGCPIPMAIKEVNIQNHIKTVQIANLGPARPSSPGNYWTQKAEDMGVSVEEARKQLCSNCAFYVNTTAIQDCYKKNKDLGNIPLATEVNPAWENTDDAAAYCIKFDITCTASRTCDDWAAGGPILDDTLPPV